MAKYEQKTKPTQKSVDKFISSIEDKKKREDSKALLELFKKATKESPRMWGDAMIGFGHYHYKYESGHEGESAITGFAPRKQNLTLYLGYSLEHYSDIMKDLGKYKTGKGCIYIKNFEDIKPDVLQKLIRESYTYMDKKYNKK